MLDHYNLASNGNSLTNVICQAMFEQKLNNCNLPSDVRAKAELMLFVKQCSSKKLNNCNLPSDVPAKAELLLFVKQCSSKS
jgi:hypothetical protein